VVVVGGRYGVTVTVEVYALEGLDEELRAELAREVVERV
jgi:hypothetical protein